MREVCLIRHARPETDGVRRFLGQVDPPLSAAGCAQAERLRARFEGTPFAAIYASDLARCAETAAIVAAGQGRAVLARCDLREIDLGAWEGRAMADIARDFPDAYRARGRDLAGFVPPGGESFAQMADRALLAWRAILRETEGAEGAVLIVAHAGWNRALLCGLLGMPLQNLFMLAQDYGCVNRLSVAEDGFVRLCALNERP